MENDEFAYAEVDEILNYIDENYVGRIPQKIREFFKEEKNKEYKPIIDVNKSLEEQNLRRSTIVILAILNMNYWCDSEEEKKEIIQSWAENEEKAEAELREKYNPDNIFNKKKELQEEKQEIITDLIQYKEPNIFKKILNKIKGLFKRN